MIGIKLTTASVGSCLKFHHCAKSTGQTYYGNEDCLFTAGFLSRGNLKLSLNTRVAMIKQAVKQLPDQDHDCCSDGAPGGDAQSTGVSRGV